MYPGDLGDHIGMESCVDMETDTATPLSSAGGGSVHRKPWVMGKKSSMSGKKGKELPPPLPIQTLTVMKRYYTDDRRLIIKEEKAESPKFYFTAHRSNGRLTLQLVRSESSCESENNCSWCEENENLAEDDKVATVGVGDGGSGRGGGKCFSYNAAATGSCLFVNQNQLHTIRPVQI